MEFIKLCLLKEVWRKIYIKSEKTRYSISNYGRVLNDQSNKLLKPHKDNRGYLRVKLYHNSKPYTKKVHRLVAKAFINQKDPNQNTVNHKNGNKLDNFYSNLEWMTDKENNEHAFKTGLKIAGQLYGETNGASKHTEDEIIKMCELLKDGHTPKIVAELCGASVNITRDLRLKRTWKHISQNYNFPNLDEKIDRLKIEIIKLLEDNHNTTEILNSLNLNREPKYYQLIYNLKDKVKGSTTRA